MCQTAPPQLSFALSLGFVEKVSLPPTAVWTLEVARPGASTRGRRQGCAQPPTTVSEEHVSSWAQRPQHEWAAICILCEAQPLRGQVGGARLAQDLTPSPGLTRRPGERAAGARPAAGRETQGERRRLLRPGWLPSWPRQLHSPWEGVGSKPAYISSAFTFLGAPI